jgi:hypothetical protein
MNKLLTGVAVVGAVIGYVGYNRYQHQQKVKAARSAWQDEMFNKENPWGKRRNPNKFA